MKYKFLGSASGYTYSEVLREISIFDRSHLGHSYNKTYIEAIESIDWQNISSDHGAKIQFLIDWNTTHVRANRYVYLNEMKILSQNDVFKITINKYKDIILPDIDLHDDDTINDIVLLYKISENHLNPTSSSKILHMFNRCLFPIWDDAMRKELFHVNPKRPDNYLRYMRTMQGELDVIINNTMKEFELNRIESIDKIRDIDKPTYSILRIMDKINYNNSRGSSFYSVKKESNNRKEEGISMAVMTLSRKENTGLKISDFLRDYLPKIQSFSMNKEGGFTFAEEKLLWRQGKMTAAFLKQVGKKLEYQTYQVSNYDLLASMKRDREKLLSVLRKRPDLDAVIEIKVKGKKTGTPSLRSGLLD